MTICQDHLTCQDDCQTCEKAIGIVKGYVYDTEFHCYEILDTHIKIGELLKE